MLVDCLLERKDIDLYIKPTKWGETPFLYADDPKKEKYLPYIYKTYNRKSSQPFDISFQVTIPHEWDTSLANYNVGITAGIEVDRISAQWIQKSNEMNQIIVPSSFVKDVFQRTVLRDGSNLSHVTTIMEILFEGIDDKIFYPSASTDILKYDFETKFNFLFVGQWGKGADDRKNITKLIESFCKAFKDDKNVGLILKTNMFGNHPLDLFHTQRRLHNICHAVGKGDYPKIHLIHGHMSDEEMAALYCHPSVKAFVSPHHGEGFGLTLIQAAFCDVPVIATGWSAPLDFLNEGKWISLPFTMKEIPQSFYWPGVADPGAKWADVEVDDLVKAMQKFYAKPHTPKDNAVALGKVVRNKYNFESMKNIFNNSLNDIIQRYTSRTPEGMVNNTIEQVDQTPSIGYVMPRHAGDVLNSTIVVDALKKKYPDYKIYFITQPQYFDILKDNPNVYKCIAYDSNVHDHIDIMKDIFDIYFTPHFAVQYTFSNWLNHKNPTNIVHEFAKHCNVDISKTSGAVISIPPNWDHNEKLKTVMSTVKNKYIVIHNADDQRQEARHYAQFNLLIHNIKKMFTDTEVIVVGGSQEPVLDQKTSQMVIDTSGLGSFNDTAKIIAGAVAFVGIDSFPLHAANIFNVPSIGLFGSSYAAATGPYPQSPKMHTIESNRQFNKIMSCDKACYKNSCYIKSSSPCINLIEPKDIFSQFVKMMGLKEDEILFDTPDVPVSGYTTTYNCKSAGIPFKYSILSALDFCSEVVVVDGGSADGTWEELQQLSEQYPQQIVLEHKDWDFTEPGIDGQMKAFSRMLCNNEILWQFDADEIMHEDDIPKIKKLAYQLSCSRDVNILSLPVVELWGDAYHATARRHCWKWRMSKNNVNITHGIPDFDKETDSETGVVFSKGMSDGCFPVDTMTGKMIQDHNFYDPSYDDVRLYDPKGYEKIVNNMVDKHPSVWHTSWMDLENKVAQFRNFWSKQWSSLYRKPAVNRFWPDKPVDYIPSDEELKTVVDYMLKTGGEQHDDLKYIISINGSLPKYLKMWMDEKNMNTEHGVEV